MSRTMPALTFWRAPPSYILFFCKRASSVSGATPVLFSAEVADFVARTHLEFSQKLAELSVRYVRVLPEVTVNESALCRSWKETYNAVTKE